LLASTLRMLRLRAARDRAPRFAGWETEVPAPRGRDRSGSHRFSWSGAGSSCENGWRLDSRAGSTDATTTAMCIDAARFEELLASVTQKVRLPQRSPRSNQRGSHFPEGHLHCSGGVVGLAELMKIRYAESTITRLGGAHCMGKKWITLTTTSFLTMFGLSTAIVAGFDIRHWTFFVYSTVLASLGAAAQLVVMYFHQHRVEQFFGLNNGSPINIAIGSYWNKSKYNQFAGDANLRYYKHDGDKRQRRELIGAIVYPLTDVGTAAEAIQLATYINRIVEHRVNLVGDENIQDAVDGPVICLGSSTSNSVTQTVLMQLPKDLNLSFSTTSLRSWVHEGEYKSSSQIDYGILARSTSEKRISFVCAGIDELGTIALSRFLLTNWRRLPSRDFVHIYKIRKDIGAGVEKIAGKRLLPSGWSSD